MGDNYQNKAVARIHNIPRFGHSSNLASIASDDVAIKNDYIDGIAAFSIFLMCVVVVWLTVLLVLKLYFGSDRVGCAAKGGPIDPHAMQKNGISRRVRKERIQRARRLQICFLGLSMLIPCFSCLMINHGYRPFIRSLEDVVRVNDDIEYRVFRGSQLTSALSNTAEQLQTNELLDSDRFDLANTCPNYESTASGIQNLHLDSLHDNISNGVSRIRKFLQAGFVELTDGLDAVGWATKSVDTVIEHVVSNDWYLKLFLVLLNVFNMLLWTGSFLTKCGVDFHGYQRVTAWFILPTFSVLMVATVVATGFMLCIAVVNADFCSGGSLGSPHGTLRSVSYFRGYRDDSVLMNTLDYYFEGCVGADPLSFIQDAQEEVRVAGDELLQLVQAISLIDVELASEECGADLSGLLVSARELGSTLISTSGYLSSASRVAQCDEISEILNDLIDGAVCNTTVEGLGWMFGGLLAISLVSLMMISTRAALYNPLFQVTRRRRREKEFDEYRDYMAEFYDDALQWKIGNDKMSILRVDTFPTEEYHGSSNGSDNSPEIQDSHADEDTTFQTASHHEQIVMTPLTKAAVASGAKAAALAAERARQENSLEEGIFFDDESSESSEESMEQPSILSNVSSMVDRIFGGRRRNRESIGNSIASFSDSSLADSQNIPQSDYAADPKFDLLGAMNRSFDSSASQLDCYIDDAEDAEPPTPLYLGSTAQPDAPHKTVKSLGRTLGGSFLQDDR